MAIMVKMTTSSPGRSSQDRLSKPNDTCTVRRRTKNRMKAAGVQELRPMRDPWITLMVYGRIRAMLNAESPPITRLRGVMAH